MLDTESVATPTGWAIPVRTEPDPNRPAVTTGEAARRKGLSRQAITAAVRGGRLAGYAIAREGGVRPRLFVYCDVLPPADEEAESLRCELEKTRAERDRERARAVAAEDLYYRRDQARAKQQEAENAMQEFRDLFDRHRVEVSDLLRKVTGLWQEAMTLVPDAMAERVVPPFVEEQSLGLKHDQDGAATHR
jgi:hypothetical protein